MRKFIISIVMFVMVAVSFTSCLGDGAEYTYYDDTAITSFKLGTLNRKLHKTKADGTDSAYTKTLVCSKYKFNIDQLKGEIWNADSLPTGIDVSKVICTVSAKNSTSIGIKSMTSDSINAYSSTDSIDFTQSRIFNVYNTNGTAHRSYKISVNVHQEEGDSCIWTKVTEANAQIAKLTAMKVFNLEDNIYLFGNEGETPKLYTTTLTDGVNWTEMTTTPTLSVDAYKSIIMKKGVFFCISDGKLLTSVDAVNWHEIGETSLKQLIAATTIHLYALSADNKIMSSADDGATWIEEELDDDASLLPTEDLAFSCRTLQTNDKAEKVVLIGNRSLEDYPTETKAVVWTKIDEYSDGSRNHPWSYTTPSPVYFNRPPRAKNWQLISYDYPNFKAISGAGLVEKATTPLDRIYQIGDDGITWLKDSVMRMPSGFSSSETSFAMTVDKAQSVWIICGESGQVWKTRINRLVWKKEQDIFE